MLTDTFDGMWESLPLLQKEKIKSEGDVQDDLPICKQDYQSLLRELVAHDHGQGDGLVKRTVVQCCGEGGVHH